MVYLLVTDVLTFAVKPIIRHVLAFALVKWRPLFLGSRADDVSDLLFIDREWVTTFTCAFVFGLTSSQTSPSITMPQP